MEEVKQLYQKWREKKQYNTPVLFVKSPNPEFFTYLVSLRQTPIYEQNKMVFGLEVMAHLLGVSRWTIHRWTKRGVLKKHRHNRHVVYYFKNSIESLITNINRIEP